MYRETEEAFVDTLVVILKMTRELVGLSSYAITAKYLSLYKIRIDQIEK